MIRRPPRPGATGHCTIGGRLRRVGLAALAGAMICGAAPALAGAGPQGSPAAQARAAADALTEAISALEAAGEGRAQVAALTRTITAYEAGMAALREALRQAAIREAALQLRFEARRDRVARLAGVLSGIRADPGPLLLLHPGGPLGTVRAGMLLSDVMPALQAEVDQLGAELAEAAELRAAQRAAEDALRRGLTVAQAARTAMSQAIAERGTLPRRFVEDSERLRELLADADTLDAIAFALAPDLSDDSLMLSFEAARGRLALPVLGIILRRFGEADAAGVRRPGFVVATRPGALVTAPWAGTIRYMGPLLDYGNVMIIEPGSGYLLVLTGMETLYGNIGEVVAQGAPLGLMGGIVPVNAPADREFRRDPHDGGGAGDTETLYIEIRQGAEPLDPADWFAATAPTEGNGTTP